MEIKQVKIGDLKPAEYNPRKLTVDQHRQLTESIKRFGLVDPIIVNQHPGRENTVIGGHQRLKIASELGFSEVPVVYVDLDPERERELNLRLNKNLGEWDWDILANQFDEEMLKQVGFDAVYLKIDNFQANRVWTDMPEFEPKGETAYRDLIIHFEDAVAVDEFAELVEQKISPETKYINFPFKKKRQLERYCIKSVNSLVPKYPVYVISKGRWESRLTVRTLEELGIPFYLVIEPQEFSQYSQVVDKEKILILPFSNLGQGSIPARNWVWQHSIDSGVAKHWILDDNIRHFYRCYKTVRIKVVDGTIFRCAEDFVDRFKNVPMAGMNYLMFGYNRQAPFTANTRIYSCILLDNKYSYRWRGRYNEDTDLSLRFLKDGYCTILFNAFLCGKMATMSMKGGNTDQLYKQDKGVDGRLLMAKSLQEQHSDVVKIVKKWGRWQHSVDYRPFQNNEFQIDFNYLTEGLGRKNEYGMELLKDGQPIVIGRNIDFY